jgi:hypothetical protein
MTADEVLARIAANPAVMGYLDSGACAVEHVSTRSKKGADVRVDDCPCAREVTDGEDVRELGGGHYISSPTHTLGDLVRDVTG